MSVIDDYLAQSDPQARTEVERIRSIAHKVIPNYEEVISYGMPTIKCSGKSILGFSPRKNHIGIYPYSSQVISEIDELRGYSTTNGSVQERLDQLLPDALIEKIIRARMKQAGL